MLNAILEKIDINIYKSCISVMSKLINNDGCMLYRFTVSPSYVIQIECLKEVSAFCRKMNNQIWKILIVLTILFVPIANCSFNSKIISSNGMKEFHWTMIDYVDHWFCIGKSYRSFHIYIERSVSTAVSDELIHRLNKCMAAGIQTSR